MPDDPRQQPDLASMHGRLIQLDGRLRLLLLRRAGLQIRVQELRRTTALASANVRLAIAQAKTATDAPLYPTSAARQAAFTIATENDLVLHAFAALRDHV